MDIKNNKGSCLVKLVIILLYGGMIIGYPFLCYYLYRFVIARVFFYFQRCPFLAREVPNNLLLTLPLPVKIIGVFSSLITGVILFFLLRKIAHLLIRFDTALQRTIQKGRQPETERRRLKQRERQKPKITED